VNDSKLLILEDDSALRKTLQKLFASRLSGVDVLAVECLAEARSVLADQSPHVVLSDLQLGDGSGLDLLKSAAKLPARPHFIFLTGHATLESATEALRLGAFDYLQKPYEEEHLVHTVRRAFESRRLHERVRDLSELTSVPSPGEWDSTPVFQDPLSQKLFTEAGHLAVGDAPVLLTGESGTGKEVLARHIHAKSRRAAEPFVAINCAAIPETLLEAELFGFEKGAFTGASGQRKGKYELAAGGTLFLDEIGDLSIALQPKLLRVLDGHGFLRLGGQATIQPDVRIITATNRKIEAEVAAGRFREDLFYRLNVGRIDIPPLRARRADILPLADRFILSLARKYRRPNLGLSAESRKKILDYPWPGNVRELQNALERAALLSSEDSIELSPILSAAARPLMPAGGSLADLVDAYEKELIKSALAAHHRNKAAAARALGLSKQLLNYKLKKFGIG